jgi:hypothetical protein
VDISEGFSKLDISLEDIPNICQNDSNACEGLLTLQEGAVVLKEMKSGKTPGSDGYPIECYKVIWDQLGHLLVNCFNYCFDRGWMTDEQRRGVITLIPKEGKDNHELKNWRPITLLNVDYKIASKIIANRLKTILNSVISCDQTGFLPNRYIGENIRLILDIIDYVDIVNIPGLPFFLDFEKAYDKLEWVFVHKCLDVFGFGNDIKKWIKMFYSKICSCIVNNGHVSQYFTLSRSLRQGCPLSCYIFILCAEIFAIAVKKKTEH